MRAKNTYLQQRPSSLAYLLPSLKLAYNGNINENGTIRDLSGSTNHGTATAVNLLTDGMAFDGTASAIVFPSISLGTNHSIFITASMSLFNNRMFLHTGTASLPFLFFLSATSFSYRLASGNEVIFTLPAGIVAGAEFTICVIRNELNVQAFINGVSVGSGNLTTNTAFATTTIGGYTGTKFLGTINSIRIYDTILSVADVVQYHKDMTRTKLVDCFCDDEVGATKPDGWESNLVTGLIEQTPVTYTPNMAKGSKAFQITSIVTGGLSIPSNTAFGSWEFSVLTNTGRRMLIHFINQGCMARSLGYALVLGTIGGYHTMGVSLVVSNAGGGLTILLKTADNSIVTDTWYDFKITRSAASGFTVYIRGGAYGNVYTLLPVAGGSGTNPIISSVAGNNMSETFMVDIISNNSQTCKVGHIKIHDKFLDGTAMSK